MIFTKIYGISADSIKSLEEAVMTRYCYSIFDMIDDEGELVWKYSEDDPFVTGHLECKGIMLTDTMMYRLVNDIVRLRNHYTGDMNAVYDWLWHEEMMKEIDTYLNTTYPKKKNFNIEDYVAQPTNPVGVCKSLTQRHVAKRYMIAEKLLPLHHESYQQYKYV